MHNFLEEEILKSFYGEYKIGIIGKKKKTSLFICKTYIEGTGLDYNEDTIYEKEFRIHIESIKSMKKELVKGNECLIIEYMKMESIVSNSMGNIMLPKLHNMEDAIKFIMKLKEKILLEKEAEIQRQQELEKEMLLEEKRHRDECRLYFDDCYNFHILQKNNPYYEFQRDGLQFACIYIDIERNLNFLKIDGTWQEESNAVIPFNKIHYYERAGNVQYTSEINGNYKNFGGSITGATVSKAATILGGLFLGPMGMAAGAVFSHKPLKAEIPNTSFEISSDVCKIDDRSVVLNYYSDAKQQYIDIELPADIYNFLQTHLPEKKYGIVLEIEKQNAIQFHREQIINGNSILNIQENNENCIVENNADAFQSKIQKLKIMYDNGILTDEEFACEKRKILSQL